MDTKKLELFRITAQTGNLSKTAELSGYTQSGVSHQLKSLETEIGINLFIRDRYGVHLTPIGGEFLKYVQQVLQAQEKLEQFIYDVHGLEKGSLTIGTFSSVSIHWLPDILDSFQKDHPLIDIRIREGGIHEIEQWINSREVDLAFYSKQPGHSFQFISLQNDPLVAVLPKNYPVNIDSTCFKLEDFNDKLFILSEIGIDYDINRLLTSHNIHPNIRFSAQNDYSIISMVAHNLGISILPKLITKGCEEQIQTLPLDPSFSRELGIGLIDFKQATPITQKFIWYVEEYFKSSAF